MTLPVTVVSTAMSHPALSTSETARISSCVVGELGVITACARESAATKMAATARQVANEIRIAVKYYYIRGNASLALCRRSV